VLFRSAGPRWVHAWSGQVYDGGRHVDQPAPLSEIPVYLRHGADVPVVAPEPGLPA